MFLRESDKVKLPNKIGFSGKMTAGKTTISNLLADKYGYTVLPIGGRIKKVCNLLIEDRAALKEYLEILPKQTLNNDSNAVQLTFNTLEELYDINFKKYVNKHGLSNVFVKSENGVYQKNQYYRDLTQKVGIAVREIFGEQVWVQILSNEANMLVQQGEKVICDDIRLEVEYNLFYNEGYKLIHLDVNPNVQKKRIIELYNTYNETALIHPTETALDNTDFKYRLNTSVDAIEDTFLKVERVIKGEL
ncbi:hypothetical protein C1N87_30535 (plasmid) [Priestia aryabhattai]